MNQITIKIKNMHCASCAQRVEKIIKSLEGVQSASVNLAAEKAFIEYDPEKLRLSVIREAVEKAGYPTLESEKLNSTYNEKDQKQKEIKTLWIKFIVSAVFSLPLLYIAMTPMINFINLPFSNGLHHMMKNTPLVYALISFFLTIPVIIAGNKFYTLGFKSLLQRSPNMDSLIALGTSAAFIYSIYNTWQIINKNFTAVEGLYFETAGVIITLVLLGKSLEAVTKRKTNEALTKLIELAPKTALVIRKGIEKEIPIDEVEIDDIVIVKPGEKIPADGIVIDGSTSINEAMLTGESMPVDKKEGDTVYAATLNTTGSIKFKTSKIGNDTALAQIIKMAENAQNSKAPIAKTADIVSGYFVPVVCIIALLAGTAWLISGADIKFSLMIFISVLVIACPCALGLATPTAIMVGTGIGAAKGIFIKSGEALENAHKINMVVFDKTGTITEGNMSVTDIFVFGKTDQNYLLQIAASAEKNSEHPLGKAIVKKAEENGLQLFDAQNFNSLTGRGIEAVIKEQIVLVGNLNFMEEKKIELSENLKNDSEKLASEGKTSMYIAVNGNLEGIIAAADVIKSSGKKAVECLQKSGIGVIMITGDNRKTADAIAKQAGIEKVLSEILPNEKAKEIKKLQASGFKVAMVGDGINDAPALAQADIGIAIGSGTDIALESADIVLVHHDLINVFNAINLSKKTIRNIKQNLFWAFGYNVIGIPIAAGFLYLFGGPLLNPMFAAAAMSLSSVSVLLNALRLKYTNFTK